MPFLPNGSVIATTCWLQTLRSRGKTAPREGSRALSLFAGVLRFNCNLNYPAMTAASKVDARAPVKHAPPIDYDLVAKLNSMARGRHAPPGIRYYAALFTLMAMAPYASRISEKFPTYGTPTPLYAASRSIKRTKKRPSRHWPRPFPGLMDVHVGRGP